MKKVAVSDRSTSCPFDMYMRVGSILVGVHYFGYLYCRQ